MELLKVTDLHTSFFTPAGEVKAVNGISFTLEKGKVLGIVACRRFKRRNGKNQGKQNQHHLSGPDDQLKSRIYNR